MTNQQGAPEALDQLFEKLEDCIYEWSNYVRADDAPTTLPKYTAGAIKDLRTAVKTLHATLIEAQKPAPSAAEALPEGWVPLVITHEGQYPEEVAYGPQILMDRLGKWLRKYFDHVVASKAQHSPTPHADSQPAPVLDSLALMKVVMRADEALAGRCTRGTTNWAAAIGKAVQDAVLAARAPADSVTTPAGGAVAEVVMAIRPPKASPAWLPHKIIHASLQWLDSVPVGTKLYTTPPAQAQAGAELAEADRRAGAAERELASCREDVARFTRLRDQMKEQWGVDRNVSFDVVWAEALKLKKQAGAVPLTQAQVVEAFCKQPHPMQFVTAFDQGVRFAEQHHGIKGGQHGTNT